MESPPPPEVTQARVAFEYTATSPYELSIDEGETVKVLEEDDGSGWVKVANNSGGKGLVPASYVEVVGPGEKKSSVTPKTKAQYGVSICFRCFPFRWGPFLRLHDRLAVAADGRNLWCPLTVRGLYDYEATGGDEIGVKEGRMIQLTTGPRGGQNYGDGWWEGQFFSCALGVFWRASLNAEGLTFDFRLISPHILRPCSACHSYARDARRNFLWGHDTSRRFQRLRPFDPLR